MNRQTIYEMRRDLLARDQCAPQELLSDIQAVANDFATKNMCLPEYFGLYLSDAISEALHDYRADTGPDYAERLAYLDARIASIPLESWEISV